MAMYVCVYMCIYVYVCVCVCVCVCVGRRAYVCVASIHLNVEYSNRHFGVIFPRWRPLCETH